MSLKSATSSANDSSGNPRCPAHSGPLNFVAAEAGRQISGQPYHPKAKPRKFMTFRQLSNSEHSADDIQNDTDLTHHFIPKSRLKIAWSNENRTINRAMPRNSTAQNSAESAFIQNDSAKDSLLPSTIVNSSPITTVARALMPVSLHPNSPMPQFQNAGEQIRPELSDVTDMYFILLEQQSYHKILDTSDSPDQMSSAITPPTHFFETHTISQFACVPNVALPVHQQTSSPQSTFDDDNWRHIESDINDYMHSSSSGSLRDSSPALCSSNVVTPNTSPSPMSGTATKLETVPDISSKKHQNHFDTQSSPLNVSSSLQNMLPTPAPARSIGVIDDAVLIALTEPFLMAWCQDITQDSLALHTQDYWDGNSVDNLWCLDPEMTR